MENKYFKNIQLSIENIQLNYVASSDRNVQIVGKWLYYLLTSTGIILWVVFNIVAFESNQFPAYLLVIMNLILYCIIAVMINPDKYSS